jgi:hypothetical protein
VEEIHAMLRWTLLTLALGALFLTVPGPAHSCSLCGASLRQAPTFREEGALETARIIFIGTAENSDATAGTTDLRISELLRSDPALGGTKVVKLSRWLPVDPKNPARFLVFCDIFKGKFDPFRGVPLKSDDAIEYARKVMKLDAKDRTANLLFFFRFLENPDVEIGRDAFLEFAKASDQDIARVAGKLDPKKLRRWIEDPKTPTERLSVYALLLGACGIDADARFLQSLLDNPSERTTSAFDGVLGGYIHLRPREGWELAHTLLRDGRKPLPIRLAVARTVSFFHGAQPKESRDSVLKCLDAMIGQAELADIAVEDLRRWDIRDRTRDILALYGKKGYDAPLMQRAIVRYALSCKDDSGARAFLDERRKAEPDLVKEVEEALQFEK